MLGKVLKNKVINNISWIVIGKIIQMLLSLIVGMITARYLGPTNYGLIGYVNSYIGFINAICTLGLNNIIIKELIDNKDDQGKYIGTAITLKLISSIISTFLLNIIMFIMHSDSKEVVLISILSSISVIFNSMDIINYWYNSRLESKKLTIVSIIAYIISSIYKIIVIMLNKSVIWVAFSATFDTIIIAIFLFLLYKKDKGQHLMYSSQVAKKLLSRSYHFILSGLMVSIYVQTDKIMIGKMIDVTQVGFYTTAVTISSLWSFIPNAIIESLSPVINKAKKDGDNLLYRKRVKQLYTVIIYLCILYAIFICVFAKIIVLILYGEKYIDAIKPLRIVVWYCTFAYLGVAKNIWLICEGKQKYEKWFALFGAVSNLILNFILIPIFGIIGAAIASLTTQILTNFIYPLIFKDTRQITKDEISAFLLRDVIDFRKLRRNKNEFI